MYSLKDISVIIPTYNRSKDLDETLKNLTLFSKKICQVIIIDQSKNNESRKIVSKYAKSISNIEYIYSSVPSITIARNLGVNKLSNKTRLVCFIDDDVTLDKNYFEEILKIFNNYSGAKAVAGYVPSPELRKMPFIEVFLRRLFFISFGEKDRARMISAYGNTYPSTLTKVINSHWIPGVNMVYKREIFKEQQFDENLLGYTVAEDIDFSYRIFKKYPQSVFITPYAKLIHRVSNVERAPTAKMSYINQVDHFYFQYKNMVGLKQKFIFEWSLLGIAILRGLKMLITRRKEDYLKLKYFLISLKYCLIERNKIKKGLVREFPQNIV